MARRRYFRPQDNIVRGPRINEQIRRSPVRLINEDDEMVGVLAADQARTLAREAGLDLVEVAPDSDPPVCRIMDFGKFKYEQSKKDRANKARSKQSELKEVRLGRSMKIDPHDIQIRLNQARRFLIDGHKVQIVQNFRGREMIHRDRGHARMRDIIETLSDVGKLEASPRQNGRRLTMIIAPDKAKIEPIRRKMAAEAAEKAGKALPEEAEPNQAPISVDEATAPIESVEQIETTLQESPAVEQIETTPQESPAVEQPTSDEGGSSTQASQTV